MALLIDPTKTAPQNILTLVNVANDTNVGFEDVDFGTPQVIEETAEGHNTQLLLTPETELGYKLPVDITYRRVNLAIFQNTPQATVTLTGEKSETEFLTLLETQLNIVPNSLMVVDGDVANDSTLSVASPADHLLYFGSMAISIQRPFSGAFTTLASGPPNTQIGTLVAIGDMLYLYGGRQYDTDEVEHWAYDITNDQWQQLPTPPLAGRDRHSAVVIDGKMYIFGGRDTATYKDLWVFDPVDNSWTELASNSYGYYDHTAVAIGGKMYVFGGIGVFGTTNDLWEYDPATDAWTELSSTDVPAPHENHSAVVLNGQMYVFGGQNDNETYYWLYSYDPQTNAWEDRQYGEDHIYDHDAFVIDGKMYVFGGRDWNGDAQKALHSYDPEADAWTTLDIDDAVKARAGFQVATHDNKAYIYGGYVVGTGTSGDLVVIS